MRTTSARTICAETFSTRDERHTTEAMKRQAYEAHHVEPYRGRCAGGCEVDHLISLELGGADTLSNLWPQPSRGVGFHVKNKLKNRLHRQVCAGELSLTDAQRCIAADWYQCGLDLKIFDARGHLLPLP